MPDDSYKKALHRAGQSLPAAKRGTTVRNNKFVTADTVIAGALANVSGVSLSLQPGSYLLSVLPYLSQASATTAITAALTFDGQTSGFRLSSKVTAAAGHTTTVGAAVSVNPTLAAAAVSTDVLTGYITVTQTGTLQLQLSSTAGVTTLNAGSLLTAEPVLS